MSVGAAVPDAGGVVFLDPAADPADLVGKEYAGEWVTLDEARLHAFDRATYVAENTVEMDLDRYPEGLVEGFHLVAVVERLHRGVVVAGEGVHPVCTAMAKVRFVSPVHAGEPMRARGTVTSASLSGSAIEVELDTIVEVEGRDKPGFVVRWRQLWTPAGIRSDDSASRAVGDPSAEADGVLEVSAPLVGFENMVGRPFRSGWLAIEPDRQDAYAFASSAVGDPHPEPGSGRRPLAEVHLLTLLDHLVNPIVHPAGESWFGWNYGLDDVRMTGTAVSGERVRVSGTVVGVDHRGEGRLVHLLCALHTDSRPVPVLTCRWSALWLPEEV